MSIVSRALRLSLAGLLLAGPASAEITDPEMSCAHYLKGGAHKASGKAAAGVEAKVRAFCAANPKMKAMDAEIAVEGIEAARLAMEPQRLFPSPGWEKVARSAG